MLFYCADHCFSLPKWVWLWSCCHEHLWPCPTVFRQDNRSVPFHTGAQLGLGFDLKPRHPGYRAPHSIVEYGPNTSQLLFGTGCTEGFGRGRKISKAGMTRLNSEGLFGWSCPRGSRPQSIRDGGWIWLGWWPGIIKASCLGKRRAHSPSDSSSVQWFLSLALKLWPGII